MTVSDEHMDAIVSDGIAFIRSITTAYGSDTGMELWDTIASTLDPDVKGKIFFAMLTGTHEDRVTLTGAVNSANKITCIKIIRQYTGLGLTEAKNAYESPVNYGQPFALKVNPKDRRHMIDDLRQNGMIVS
jgi:ribosomal protein L7/L12